MYPTIFISVTIHKLYNTAVHDFAYNYYVPYFSGVILNAKNFAHKV
jgi:hypothetical protein